MQKRFLRCNKRTNSYQVMTESVFSDHEKSFGDKEQKNCVRLTIIDIDVLIKFAFTPVAGIL